MNIKIQHLGGFYSPKLPNNIGPETEIVIMDHTFGRPVVCAVVWELSDSVEIQLMSYSINPDSVKYGTVTYFLTENNEA